jgi:hypothetical protein
MDYDYVIVGAGPTGLCLAYILSKYKKRVALIEKNSYLGGCHAALYDRGLIYEHGPRIYIDNYLMFTQILNEMGYEFSDLFTPYKFGKSSYISDVVLKLSFREISWLLYAFITLNDSYKNTSLSDFVHIHDFSQESIELLDNIGRVTDGGNIEQYTLFNFIQIVNQNFLYTVYQPKVPNDKGLIKVWENQLVKQGVHIYKNAHITRIDHDAKKIKYISFNNQNISSKTFILAMPPYSINELIKKINIPHAFGDGFDKWSQQTNYITYIPITLHWNTKQDLETVWGFPRTEWGIAHIILSDYMKFKTSKTVITAAITKAYKVNHITDTNIIINGVIKQLQSLHPNMTKPDHAVMKENYYDGTTWVSNNTAFMTTKFGHIDFKSIFNNLYSCGVHNGQSEYAFTSLEAAIENAISLCHILISESKNDYQIKSIITVRYILYVTLIILIIIIFYEWSTTRPQ